MNTRQYLLTLTAACGLPALGLAQGTYLSAPGGNPANAVVVVPGGNVGIGTASPDARLDVWGGDTNAVFAVVKGSGPTESPVFQVFKNNPKQDDTLSFTILRSGNVGIGVPVPQVRLDVAGDIRCTVMELTSDRNAKTGCLPADCATILEKVARLPISTWQYTNAPGVTHLGPMAQDFQAAFTLGADDKHIATVDADGVALAAIQALYQELARCDLRLKAKEAHLTRLEEQVRRLERLLVARTALLEGEETQAAPDGGAPVQSVAATLPPGAH